MLLYKGSLLFLLTILLGYGWGASSKPKEDPQGSPKFEYSKLFLPSPHFCGSSGTDVLNVLEQANASSEKSYYCWLLSHVPLLRVAIRKVTGLSSPKLGGLQTLPPAEKFDLYAVEAIERLVLSVEIRGRINKYADQQRLQKQKTSRPRHPDTSDTWEKKHSGKLATFDSLAGPLKARFSGEHLRVLLYELAYFLNLLSFETSFKVLQGHRQREEEYTRVLVNTLGDSLLDSGKQIRKFYGQSETAIETIGYSPKDLLAFKGAHGHGIAGTFRDIIGHLVSKSDDTGEQGRFVRRMWRAACTIHLTTTFQYAFRGGEGWEEEFAPKLYQAIEKGKKEVFDSGYDLYNGFAYIKGHSMLTEVERTSDRNYHVRLFNSGNGLGNHKKWPDDPKVWRFLSFVDIPRVSEDRIKQTGYYYANAPTDKAVLRKLYKNNHLARNTSTDPLLYERPQQAGTCTTSSKMVYFRLFGLKGRLLEIDFKVELIKQLLDRIDRVHARGSSSRPAILQLVKAEEKARLTKNMVKEAEIRKGREGVLKALKMEEADQYIFLFPEMFISLIASALNDILSSLYWIIKYDESDMAKNLFEHFLKETEPIFKGTSSHGSQLLERVSPLIRDIHGKLLKEDAELPFGLAPTGYGKRPVAMQEAIARKMKEISENCMSFLSESSGGETEDYSRAVFPEEKLPACFYHVIDAVRAFPYAPELARITSWLSKKLYFGKVPPELSYILIDTMRNVYGEEFYMDDKAMRQVAFAPKLDWSYQPPGGSTDKDCGKYSYEDMMTKRLGDLARCIYLRNELLNRSPLPLLNGIFTIRRACNPLTEEGLPVCFYCIIKVIRAYPDAPELELVTKEMLNTSLVPGNFKFKDTPPALAYLLLNAMRSSFGEYGGVNQYSGPNSIRWNRIKFCSMVPDSYEGDERFPTEDCDQVTDEHIIEYWEHVAACRFNENRSAV